MVGLPRNNGARRTFIYLGTPQDAVVTIGRSELTVHLHNSWGLRQELQARLARGESVEVPIPKRREELLRAVEAARAAEPAIPTPLDAPPPPQAAAPAAQAPAAQAPVAQALVVLDASLVGRRVLVGCWRYGAILTTHLRASLGTPRRS